MRVVLSRSFYGVDDEVTKKISYLGDFTFTLLMNSKEASATSVPISGSALVHVASHYQKNINRCYNDEHGCDNDSTLKCNGDRNDERKYSIGGTYHPNTDKAAILFTDSSTRTDEFCYNRIIGPVSQLFNRDASGEVGEIKEFDFKTGKNDYSRHTLESNKLTKSDIFEDCEGSVCKKELSESYQINFSPSEFSKPPELKPFDK